MEWETHQLQPGRKSPPVLYHPHSELRLGTVASPDGEQGQGSLTTVSENVQPGDIFPGATAEAADFQL